MEMITFSEGVSGRIKRVLVMIREVQSTEVNLLRALNFILMAVEANDVWQTEGHREAL